VLLVVVGVVAVVVELAVVVLREVVPVVALVEVVVVVALVLVVVVLGVVSVVELVCVAGGVVLVLVRPIAVGAGSVDVAVVGDDVLGTVGLALVDGVAGIVALAPGAVVDPARHSRPANVASLCASWLRFICKAPLSDAGRLATRSSNFAVAFFTAEQSRVLAADETAAS
jgi:hypothetical protein